MTVEVRFGTSEDVEFVQRLASESVVYGIPYNRDIENAQVQTGSQRFLEGLDKRLEEEHFRLLVAIEGGSQRRLGYLMLELDQVEASTGERQSAIYDLAVVPEFWGRRVVHRLVEAAAKETARAGLRYMIGEVTASNRRTLLQAQRLGFVVERHQIAMHCGPDGALPMPGRSDEQKAHKQSRRGKE